MTSQLQLYKYKSLKGDGFKHFVDIILNERLYASNYRNLRENGNDKKEGAYYFSITDEKIKDIFVKEVLDQKSRIKICCLSKDGNSDVMWKEYADNYSGVLIIVEINENRCSPITYVETFPTISYSEELNHKDMAKQILSHKLQDFTYEEEMRIFTIGNKYVNIKVKEVIAGREMADEDFEFIKKLVNRIKPEILIKRQEYNNLNIFL